MLKATPGSSSIGRPTGSMNPRFVPSSRTPRHPAGIQARQDQLAAHQRNNEFETKVAGCLVVILTYLVDKCIMCLMTGKNDWEKHKSDDCTKGTGTNRGDPDFTSFRKIAIRLPVGWCYGCLLHQVRVFKRFLFDLI